MIIKFGDVEARAADSAVSTRPLTEFQSFEPLARKIVVFDPTFSAASSTAWAKAFRPVSASSRSGSGRFAESLRMAPEVGLEPTVLRTANAPRHEAAGDVPSKVIDSGITNRSGEFFPEAA